MHILVHHLPRKQSMLWMKHCSVVLGNRDTAQLGSTALGMPARTLQHSMVQQAMSRRTRVVLHCQATCAHNTAQLELQKVARSEHGKNVGCTEETNVQGMFQQNPAAQQRGSQIRRALPTLYEYRAGTSAALLGCTAA